MYEVVKVSHGNSPSVRVCRSSPPLHHISITNQLCNMPKYKVWIASPDIEIAVVFAQDHGYEVASTLIVRANSACIPMPIFHLRITNQLLSKTTFPPFFRERERERERDAKHSYKLYYYPTLSVQGDWKNDIIDEYECIKWRTIIRSPVVCYVTPLLHRISIYNYL